MENDPEYHLNILEKYLINTLKRDRTYPRKWRTLKSTKGGEIVCRRISAFYIYYLEMIINVRIEKQVYCIFIVRSLVICRENKY